MTTPTTSSSTITQRLLGELAHVPNQLFSRHRDTLPEATPVPTGAPGRPSLAYNIDDIAALVAQQTAHLSDLACRIRCALGCQSPLRIVEADGKHHVVHDDEPLSDLAPAVRTALLEQIHADNAAAPRRRTRRHPATEETQP